MAGKEEAARQRASQRIASGSPVRRSGNRSAMQSPSRLPPSSPIGRLNRAPAPLLQRRSSPALLGGRSVSRTAQNTAQAPPAPFLRQRSAPVLQHSARWNGVPDNVSVGRAAPATLQQQRHQVPEFHPTVYMNNSQCQGQTQNNSTGMSQSQTNQSQQKQYGTSQMYSSLPMPPPVQPVPQPYFNQHYAMPADVGHQSGLQHGVSAAYVSNSAQPYVLPHEDNYSQHQHQGVPYPQLPENGSYSHAPAHAAAYADMPTGAPVTSMYNHNSMPLPPQYNSTPMTSQYNSMPMTSQYSNSMPMTAQYNNMPMTSQYDNVPVVSQHNNMPVVSQYNHAPMVSQYSNTMPPASSQYSNVPAYTQGQSVQRSQGFDESLSSNLVSTFSGEAELRRLSAGAPSLLPHALLDDIESPEKRSSADIWRFESSGSENAMPDLGDTLAPLPDLPALQNYRQFAMNPPAKEPVPTTPCAKAASKRTSPMTMLGGSRVSPGTMAARKDVSPISRPLLMVSAWLRMRALQGDERGGRVREQWKASVGP